MTPTSILPLTPLQRARLEQTPGIIFDIQRHSVHDGPGLRTNVFFKGCPLRCDWCANPESQAQPPQLALFAANCLACGQFDPPCPACWMGQTGTAEDFDRRAAVCPTAAIREIGERRTTGEIMREVWRDFPFYGGGGGLTLTGGEPTMQPNLAEALLRLARTDGISTAMETCGHTPWATLARLWPHLDDILYDLKHLDDALHRQHTGVSNGLILDNLRRLTAAGAPVTIRIPLIPGFNATANAMQAMARFAARLPGPVRGIHLLPYHTLGKAKYSALGRDYPWAEYNRLTTAEVQALADAAEAGGLPVLVGG
jgi:pyruvate formate lyase activating enzyme